MSPYFRDTASQFGPNKDLLDLVEFLDKNVIQSVKIGRSLRENYLYLEFPDEGVYYTLGVVKVVRS